MKTTTKMGTRSVTLYTVRKKSDGKFHHLAGPHCEDRWANSPSVLQAEYTKAAAYCSAANIQHRNYDLKGDVEVCELIVSWD